MAQRRRLRSIAAAIVLQACTVQAFYLPGTAPKDYKRGDHVPVFVNALTPIIGPGHPKLSSIINYDYYYPAFHFCQPEGGFKKQAESLGSILFGDRIFTSAYDIKMMQDESCKSLCKATIPGDDAKFINERIKEDYAVNWLVDGLPAAEEKVDRRTNETFYDIGFNLGNDDEGPFAENPALNNHYEVYIKYHERDAQIYRVVGVLVWPRSVSTSTSGDSSCGQASAGPMILREDQDNTVAFTYNVHWESSPVRWATRWDNYLHITDPRIHWFSLFNSIIIVVFLCAMVGMILLRTVHRDISRYNAIDLSEDVQEDYGWKLVHGEVFRAPARPMVLSVFVGNGAQLIAMVLVTLVFALLGFLSPSNRGALATVMLVCWTFFACIGGYVSARVYTALDGTDHKMNLFFTATLLPTFVCVIMFLLNLLLIANDSSGAVPFGTVLIIVLMWFGISVPLASIGGLIGQRHGGVSHPVRVNQIPRQIPPAPKYLRLWTSTLLCGILPFVAAFVELYFVLSSLFASRAYYAFGFLALASGVVVITTATVTILLCYFLLCAEEYRWHWRAFIAGGGSSIWLLGYGLYNWVSRLSLDSFSSVMLYFGYLFVIATFNFLVTGTIGFIAAYWAVRRLYGSIRID